MKIRNGFVSNSSSSSFILKFDKLPESVEEVRELLYGENPPLFATFWSDDAVSTKKVAEILFRDIEGYSKGNGIMDVDDVVRGVKDELYFSEYSGEEGRDFVVGTEFIEEFDVLLNKVIQKDKDFNKIRYQDSGNRMTNWEKHHKELEEMSKPLVDIIEKCIRMKYNDDSKYIEVEYSDNDGQIFSYMEHSGILDKITVQRFSHH